MPMVQLILNQNRRSRKRRSSKKKKLHLKVGIATGTAATGKFKEVTGVMQKEVNVRNVGELFVKLKTPLLNLPIL